MKFASQIGVRQEAFAAALLSPGVQPPRGLRVPAGADASHRFAVYRNNVFAGLSNALAARFPVVKRLVGDEFFALMARIHIAGNPPRSPLMFRYGESFPAFIRRFPPAAGIPYLADVARLEYLRGEAYHAADATPVEARRFSRLSGVALLATRVALHPSMRLLASSFPVVSIWSVHQDDATPMVARWKAESALVARPELEVEVRLLPTGGYAFVEAIASGATIGGAASTAAEVHPSFDVAQVFATLLAARIVIGLM